MLPQSYELLLGDIKATVLGNKYKSIGLLYHEGIEETLINRKNQLTNSSSQFIRNILQFDSSLYYSQAYITEVFNILFSNYSNLLFLKKIEPGITNKYKYLNVNLPSTLRRPIIAKFISEDLYKMKTIDEVKELREIIEKTYTKPSDSVYTYSIEAKMKTLFSIKNGMQAPGFELENERGEIVSLETFRGKVIFIDFWFEACGPCHILFNELKPIKKYYENNENIIFLSVSIDSKDTWLKALKKHEIAGQHLYTQNKGVGHPIINSYRVLGYPTTYIIDKNGKIFSANPSMNKIDLQNEIEQALLVKNY
jgi:peroxiredoxin